MFLFSIKIFNEKSLIKKVFLLIIIITFSIKLLNNITFGQTLKNEEGQELIKDGEFNYGLQYWRKIEGEGFRIESTREGCLTKPPCVVYKGYNFWTLGFGQLEQDLVLPRGKITLSFIVWRGEIDSNPTILKVMVKDSAEKITLLDDFTPRKAGMSGPPDFRHYDLSPFGGQTITLIFRFETKADYNGWAHLDNVSVIFIPTITTSMVINETFITTIFTTFSVTAFATQMITKNITTVTTITEVITEFNTLTQTTTLTIPTVTTESIAQIVTKNITVTTVTTTELKTLTKTLTSTLNMTTIVEKLGQMFVIPILLPIFMFIGMFSIFYWVLGDIKDIKESIPLHTGISLLLAFLSAIFGFRIAPFFTKPIPLGYTTIEIIDIIILTLFILIVFIPLLLFIIKILKEYLS